MRRQLKNIIKFWCDTLLGYYLRPYKNRIKRDDLVATPKFYFFDVGIINALTKRKVESLRGINAGNAFEHYIFMELIAYRGLNDLDMDICFWRKKSGYEIDFVINDAEVAIEVKIKENVRRFDIRGLVAFNEDYKPKKSIVVCNTQRKQKLLIGEKGNFIEIYPWEVFLIELWDGKIVK